MSRFLRAVRTPSPRLAITFIFLIRGFILGNWFPRIPGIAERLEITGSQLGIIWFCTALGCIASFAVAARLTRRLGNRRTILLYALPYPVVFAIIGLAPTTLAFGIGMVAFGLLNGGFDVTTSVQGGIVERVTRRQVLSSLYGYFSLGALLGSFASGLVAQAGFSITTHYAVLAAIATPLLAMLNRHLVDEPTPVPAASTTVARRRIQLPPKALWPLGFMVIFAAIGEESINNWVALYMRQDLGAAPAVAGFAYTAFALASAAGRLGGDAVIRRFGADAVLGGGSVLAASGIAFGLLVNQPWALLAGYAAVGAGLSIVIPVTYRRASDTPGIAPAAAVSAVASIGYLGFMFGPLLVGVVADLASLRTALAVVAASMLGIGALTQLAAATTLAHRETPSRPATPRAEPGTSLA